MAFQYLFTPNYFDFCWNRDYFDQNFNNKKSWEKETKRQKKVKSLWVHMAFPDHGKPTVNPHQKLKKARRRSNSGFSRLF
jgi:hypothetical protein